MGSKGAQPSLLLLRTGYAGLAALAADVAESIKTPLIPGDR
jgi:hypothetical protein